MNIKELHYALKELIASGISEEQAWTQIETMKIVITDTLTPVVTDFNNKVDKISSEFSNKVDKISSDFSNKVDKMKLEMKIFLGSIMAMSVILSTGIIGILIFLKS